MSTLETCKTQWKVFMMLILLRKICNICFKKSDAQLIIKLYITINMQNEPG